LRKSIVAILFFVLGSGAKSQNFVPDPTFSNVILCRNSSGLWEYTHWFDTPRPDTSSNFNHFSFHNLCEPQWSFNRPGYNNYKSYSLPMPVIGTGYAGFEPLEIWVHTFQPQYPSWRGRSFLQTKLSAPLQMGDSLMVEFYTAMFETSSEKIQGVGAYFSTDTFKLYDYLNVNPHIEASTILGDTNWVRISGTYVAQGGEEFLTIGNFRPIDSTNKVDNPYAPTPWFAEDPTRYLVDGVSVYLFQDLAFEVNLPNDTLLCIGDSLTLYARHSNGFKIPVTSKTFTWSTGSKDSSITIGSPGTYWVKVEYNGQFAAYDTIVVNYVPDIQLSLPPDTSLCQDETLLLEAPNSPYFSYLWNDGSAGSSLVAGEGTHSVTVNSICGTASDDITITYINCDTTDTTTVNTNLLPVYIPSAFTPNGDGLNDTWAIGNLPEENELVIFNRWGELIYRKVNYQNEWEGTNRDGSKLPLGIYIYQLTYSHNNGKTVIDQGWVSVLDN
jgi:gliding motility-associated-like protein